MQLRRFAGVPEGEKKTRELRVLIWSKHSAQLPSENPDDETPIYVHYLHRRLHVSPRPYSTRPSFFEVFDDGDSSINEDFEFNVHITQTKYGQEPQSIDATIDRQTGKLSLDLSSIKSMTIGIGGDGSTGTGKMFFDNIRIGTALPSGETGMP